MFTHQAPVDILIVDDEVDIRETTAELLREHGYRVGTASDGGRALEHLAANPAPAVILLDLGMEPVTGYEFMRVRDGHPCLSRIPVVLVTGFPNVPSRPHPEGAVLALLKPVSPQLLLCVVSVFARRTSEITTPTGSPASRT